MSSDTHDTDDGRTADLEGDILNAIQRPDERLGFIESALDRIPEGHPNADDIRAELEAALHLINEVHDDPSFRDVTGHLRGAYGDLPLGPDAAESTASDGEDGQDGPEAVTDGGEAVTADDGDESAEESDDRFGYAIPDVETAQDEATVLYLDEGDTEAVREQLDDLGGHRRDTYGLVEVLLPTAEIERILLEMEDTNHDTVAGFLRGGLAWMFNYFDGQLDEARTQVDVPISEAAWERARLDAAASYQRGKDRDLAFWDTMAEHGPHHNNYHIEGAGPSEEPLGPDDLPVVEDADEA